MKRFTIITIIVLLSLTLLLTACGSPVAAPTATTAPSQPTATTPPQPTATPEPTAAPPAEPIKVQLGVGYIPNVQFAPLYVAIDKGFFAEEGLDVSMEYGFETDFLKLVGTGERDFAIASGDQIILARAQGLPTTYVAQWYSKYPIVIFSLAEKGIKTPQDLIGKKVGIPGLFGASYVGWKALVTAANLPEDQIQLESIGFTQAAAVQQGLVDAANDYAANGPVQLQVQGIPTNVIVIDDYMHLPANGLITSDKLIAEHPERVEGMVRAMLRGVAYTLAHPDEAFEISLKFVPEAAQNKEINRAILDASLPYWTPASPDALGHSDAATWSNLASFMKDAGLVDQLVDTEGIWRNDFVEKANVTLGK